MDEKKEDLKKTEKPKSKAWCCWVPALILVLAIIGLIIYQFIPQDYSRQAPARNYKLPEPSIEALNRNLDCNEWRAYNLNKDKYRPLCLNLFKATEDQVNTAANSGKYNRVMLYGERSTYAITVPDEIRNVPNLGKALLQTAKFNDLITIPNLMEYYGLEDLSYIPKEFGPYQAISYIFADQEGMKQECGAYVGGCAILNFGTVIKDTFLSDPKNWGQRFTKENGDYLEIDNNWPADCFADTTMMHETGHNFLVANKITITGMISDGWISAPSYFNENLTEIMTMYLSNEICGPKTTVVDRELLEGKPATGGIVEFNGVFPPTLMHPSSFPKDNECEQAIISSFSHYLARGDFKTQFTQFVTTFRRAMAGQEKFNAYKDDTLMANFMLQMQDNDPAEQEFLVSHGCSL